jgi:hypothetical protein
MSLKQLVNSHEVYQDFLAHLKGRIEILQKSLEVATDLPDVYRLQGQIYALRRLLSLREEVNTMEK